MCKAFTCWVCCLLQCYEFCKMNIPLKKLISLAVEQRNDLTREFGENDLCDGRLINILNALDVISVNISDDRDTMTVVLP